MILNFFHHGSKQNRIARFGFVGDCDVSSDFMQSLVH